MLLFFKAKIVSAVAKCVMYRKNILDRRLDVK